MQGISGQKDVANLTDLILKTKLGHSPCDNKKSVNGRVPAYSLFSDVKDPMVCALTAMLVGCDACQKRELRMLVQTWQKTFLTSTAICLVSSFMKHWQRQSV
jgi:hypothetical protein